ncbi:acetoacetate decarboxylase family protein [Streptomyces sp. FIT100]|uniref:acetoacetate decarboxylase family protein n=1 Tax=Streptomyces sp. FIT100 TaxID=2837956 RepID=UPI0021C6C3D0|nr:acetoacetate decarboxylase family protein [Streptomyces sp. FIT100]UUN26332.1 acetoacetate decarboxylase family protein [Streptomyces sp. FIT100]
MTHVDLPPEVPYPPPPWHVTGQLWMAAAECSHEIAVPSDLNAVGRARRLVIGLVRYGTGTLRYDELAVGSLVRRGHRIGMLAQHVWVDEPASLWGGRRLWGIPKQLASFEWDGPAVCIRSGASPLAELMVRPAANWILRPLPLPLPATGFGQVGDQRVFLPGRMRARLAPATIEIRRWSAPLPPITGTHLGALGSVRCRFTFPTGRALGPVDATGQPSRT